MQICTRVYFWPCERCFKNLHPGANLLLSSRWCKFICIRVQIVHMNMQLVFDSSKRHFSRRLIADQSATSRRLVGDHLATYATSSRSKSVAASLLCMLKRQLATDFNRRLVGDFKKTFPRPLQPLRDFSFFSREPVAKRLQSRCKHALTDCPDMTQAAYR